MESVQTYLKWAVEENASDLFVVAGRAVSIKRDGEMPRVMLAIFMISSGMSISRQLGMPKLTIRITADREPLCR